MAWVCWQSPIWSHCCDTGHRWCGRQRPALWPGSAINMVCYFIVVVMSGTVTNHRTLFGYGGMFTDGNRVRTAQAHGVEALQAMTTDQDVRSADTQAAVHALAMLLQNGMCMSGCLVVSKTHSYTVLGYWIAEALCTKMAQSPALITLVVASTQAGSFRGAQALSLLAQSGTRNAHPSRVDLLSLCLGCLNVSSFAPCPAPCNGVG